MKTPRFWDSGNTLSNLLLPLSWVYGAVSGLRMGLVKPVMLPVPVICIGNLTAGGAGKTPLALHIGKKLQGQGVFFLSKGYGGRLKGPVLVQPQHSAAEVGDEPLLLAGCLPTVVAKDRLAGARFAIGHGAKAIIMDDGFQNPAFVKTLSLLVVDARRGFGNGRLLPAGPLREPVARGIKRAHAALVMNGEYEMALPQLHGRLEARDAQRWQGKRVIAFCGIAYPDKFFDMLRSLGAIVVEAVPFADHYLYKPSDIEPLVNRAAQAQAALVTTAKDAVRLTPALREKVQVLDVSLEVDEEALLDQLLAKALNEKN